MALLQEILEICVIPLLGILTTYLVAFIKAKKNELIKKTEQIENERKQELTQKYLELAEDTVVKCVIATNQTFVDSLKAKGDFTEEAWKEAFQKTYTSVTKILAGEAEMYLTESVGDLKVYLTNLIEAAVAENKINIA